MTQLQIENILRYAYQWYLGSLISKQNALSYRDRLVINRDRVLRQYNFSNAI